MAGRVGLNRVTSQVLRVSRGVRAVGVRGSLGHLRRKAASRVTVTLCVVVEVADHDRLGHCLASVLPQLEAGDEVLLCPVGAALPHVGDSTFPRTRVLASQDTWQQAANVGVEQARGRYVGFIRSSDRWLPQALHQLRVATRSDAGAVGVEGRLRAAGPHGGALPHRLALGNRLLRREVWATSGCQFADQDQWLLSVTLGQFLMVGKFVTLEREVCEFANEFASAGGLASWAARPSPLRHLASWAASAAAAEARLGREGVDALQEDTASGWLPHFLMDAERATDDQWRLLVQLAQESRTIFPESHVRATPARVLRWLTAADRRTTVVELAAELADLGQAARTNGDVPTRVVDTRVLAAWRSLPADFPQAIARLSPAETRLRTHLQRVVREGHISFADVFVAIDGVDSADKNTVLVADDESGASVPVVRLDEDAAATRWLQRRFQSAAGGSFRLTVDGPGASVLTLRFSVDGVVRRGQLVIPVAAPAAKAGGGLVVDSVGLTHRSLVVDGDGRLSGLALEPETPTASDEVAQRVTNLGADGVRLSLERVHYGRQGLWPTGHYRLAVQQGALKASPRLRAASPEHLVGPDFRLQVEVSPRAGRRESDTISVWLRPPLTDDELGPYAQQRLQQHYRDSPSRVDHDLFYFESYLGAAATDNPLAIWQELRRQVPSARGRWGVTDYGQWVPEGVEPVIRGSAEWYDVLATAGCLVVNTDVEPWFRKRPGQLLLQCFHGYPAKAMGAMQWRLNQLPPREIRSLRARGVDTWDVILTPTPAMTSHYRAQYDYHGPAIEQGYPRNDVLTSESVMTRRTHARELLGIGPDQVAVLYAPTWRDHLSVRPRQAEMTDYFDAEQAAAALGDSHVVLVRGHRFHTSRSKSGTLAAGRIIDVTDYPEINDVIAASDVAVLDYSSLRFDYALTGKPMVFLVPDLDDFSGAERGFLFPFLDSTPGPLVDDTAAVIDLVRDVQRLTDQYADRLASFNETFNPHQDGRAAERAVTELLRLRQA